MFCADGDGMEILGLIPARGGSKGIPGKNLVPLVGKPLLAYTCEAARKSKKLTRTILSTDSEEIAKIGRSCGVEVPFLRPLSLAADETPMIDVARHALDALRNEQYYEPDIVVLLQPTSPLREAEHIDVAVGLLLESGADTVVSVIPVPHQFLPTSLMRLDGGRLVFCVPDAPLRRQEKESLYARNGPAILAVRMPVLRERGLYGANIRPFVMDAEHSVDIDGSEDLAFAEFLIRKRYQVAI
jgi:CMP-N-acetylneuraminic acid synthetase